MKTLKSLIFEADLKRDYWLDVMEDPQALKDLGKTHTDAAVLANYFEGKREGLCDSLRYS